MQFENNNIKEDELLYETRSPEAQEIIGRMPSWIVKYGVSLLVGILLLIFLAANFLKYPDIMSATLVISASEFPEKVVAKKTGNLAELFIKDGDYVTKNQIIATLEDSADIDDVLYLKEMLISVDTAIELGKTSTIIANKNLQLGLLQSYYSGFLISLNDYKKFNSEKKELQLLLEQNVRANVKNVINVIRDWEGRNILRSPANGKVSFLNDLKKKSKIKNEEIIMTINPDVDPTVTVTGTIAGTQSSKVKKGNHVILKVDNYPHENFGTLNGIITKITPLDSGYFVNVKLVNGLKTSTDFVIPAQSILTANGDIILNDKTILQRLFDKYNSK